MSHKTADRTAELENLIERMRFTISRRKTRSTPLPSSSTHSRPARPVTTGESPDPVHPLCRAM